MPMASRAHESDEKEIKKKLERILIYIQLNPTGMSAPTC